MPDHLPLPPRQVYTPMITDAPGLNWVGPGDAWTRAWAQQPPQGSATAGSAAAPVVPADPASTGSGTGVGTGVGTGSGGGSGQPFRPLPPLLSPETALAVIPLAARARNAEPDRELVRRSLAAVEAVADRAVAHFYAVLFVGNPELRSLFPASMDLQRDRLFRALLAAARVADDPAALAQLVEPLARGHRKYGVRNEHYAPVGAALIAALARFGGGAWDRHTEAAWARTYAAVSQLMIAVAERDAVVSPPWWQGEVVAVEPLTGEVGQVTVRTDHPYPYRAGQYATLEVPLWPRVWRPYSLAAAPRPDGLLTFQVKAVPAGWVSNALVRRTGPGDVLRLGPPAGQMVLRPGSTTPLLLVGGGTGIAPILALLQELAERPRSQRPKVELFYGARRASELYALGALTELAKRHSWLHVRTTVLEGRHRGLSGPLPDVVAGLGPWDEYEAYLSGPPAMVRRGVRALYAAGVAEERIRHDLGTDGPA
ncbi:globin domain-containing protein [Streptacidiphilus sp. P02-A3a]|uniref:globin domain-containing protein n=1 Tax=Streptacidiphilus sp. P02-A3a TaxID=2704468 RepID=UPI0015F9C5FF|nr:globin domain-containing protein [Streptacidiphilus sp. P02-A3a]QMU66885.1 flavohemoprotein [Streptacidiphilus sp. P02-A3a]